MKAIHTKFEDERIIPLLLEGEVVSFPTETVYGLGVVYDNEEAFNKLVKAKNRTPDKPFTLMLSSINDIGSYALVTPSIKNVIKKFMPGEITLLLKPKDHLYPWVKLNSEYIGVRVPDYDEVRKLIHDTHKPLLVTSANISGQPVLKNYEEVCATFDDKIAAIIKGDTRSSVPSSIFILDECGVREIRKGNIPLEAVEKVYRGED